MMIILKLLPQLSWEVLILPLWRYLNLLMLPDFTLFILTTKESS